MSKLFAALVVTVGGAMQVFGVLTVVWDLRAMTKRIKEFESRPGLTRPVGRSLGLRWGVEATNKAAASLSQEERLLAVEDELASVEGRMQQAVGEAVENPQREVTQDIRNVDAFRKEDTDALRGLVLDVTGGGKRLRLLGVALIVVGLILSTIGSVWSLTV